MEVTPRTAFSRMLLQITNFQKPLMWFATGNLTTGAVDRMSSADIMNIPQRK
jgi:hypothetical protein